MIDSARLKSEKRARVVGCFSVQVNRSKDLAELV